MEYVGVMREGVFWLGGGSLGGYLMSRTLPVFVLQLKKVHGPKRSVSSEVNAVL